MTHARLGSVELRSVPAVGSEGQGVAGGAADLIERIMRAYGIDPAERGAVPQLARASGLPERYLYRWMEKTPSYENAVDLLERAGMLRSPRERSDAEDDLTEQALKILTAKRVSPQMAAVGKALAQNLRRQARAYQAMAKRLDELT